MGYAEHINAPAIAANALPTANVMEMVAFTFTPISWAAPLSSETASIARPIFVLFTNSHSTTMIMAETIIVTSVSPEITRRPSNRRKGANDTIELKDFGAEPQISSAIFCKK